eukprot:ctg_2606.g770
MEGLSTTLQECLHEFSVLADEDLLVSEGRGVGGGGGARAGCTRGLARDQVADARAPVTRAVEGGVPIRSRLPAADAVGRQIARARRAAGAAAGAGARGGTAASDGVGGGTTPTATVRCGRPGD